MTSLGGAPVNKNDKNRKLVKRPSERGEKIKQKEILNPPKEKPKNLYVIDPQKMKEGDDKFLVKNTTAHFPGIKNIDPKVNESPDLTYEKKEVDRDEVYKGKRKETYREAVIRSHREYDEKKLKEEGDNITEIKDEEMTGKNLDFHKSEVSKENYRDQVARMGKKYTDKLNQKTQERKIENESNSEVKTENTNNEKAEESISEEIKAEPVKVKKEKREPKKTLAETTSDLQKANIQDLFVKNMQKMQGLPLQEKLSDRLKKVDIDIVNKMNRGEDISGMMQDLNYVAQDINDSQEEGKEGLQKEYDQLQKEIKNYNEANHIKKEAPQKEKIKTNKKTTQENNPISEVVNVDQKIGDNKSEPLKNPETNPEIKTQEAQEDKKEINKTAPDIVFDITGFDSPEERDSFIKAKEKEFPGYKFQYKEGKVFNSKLESVSENVNTGNKNLENLQDKKINNNQENLVPKENNNTQEISSTTLNTKIAESKAKSTESAPEEESIEQIVNRLNKKAEAVENTSFDPKNEKIEEIVKRLEKKSEEKKEKKEKKDKKNKKEGFWGGIGNFFDKLRSESRESLLKREARLESPALKRKLEEMNSDVEKKIGKLGNKSLNIIWDVALGNAFRAIGDGIKSNKNWSGSIGEGVGSLVTRYLNSAANIVEVVFGLVGALGKKSWRGIRKLVAK